jgi:PPOX class probable F420-dependent enzyme
MAVPLRSASTSCRRSPAISPDRLGAPVRPCYDRPQLSNVGYLLDDDGLVKISVTQDRAKVHNVRRDPRIALTALGDDWYEYVVVAGTAHLIEDDPLPLLRHVYRAVAGKEHLDWPRFDEAMVRDHHLVLAIAVDRLYPLQP